MEHVFSVLWPEILLATVGSILLLLGVVKTSGARMLAPVVALATLLIVFIAFLIGAPAGGQLTLNGTAALSSFQEYIKLITAGVGILLVLLAWPTNRDATGNPSIQYGHDAAEFFGLMLLSLSGILFVATANDIVVLFLGIELASIPTYIMVAISRPIPAAQEAGVKYFFLGAMAAAVMLFGFSYLYGITGQTNLAKISEALWFRTGSLPGQEWKTLAIVMLIAGFAFKIAAVPLHAYAADVYQGAATPVTAFLAFVPKTSGFVALIKILYAVSAVGATHWVLSDTIVKLLWVLAVLTMFVGNTLGLLQHNVKRTLAYSSIAHSGYMLAALTALVSTSDPAVQSMALGGILFYLAAYGIMNSGAFGVLMLLPSRESSNLALLETSSGGASSATPTGTSAETFDDIAGQGRKYPAMGLAMAVCCWSLTGLPLTIGFFGKFYLIIPILEAGKANPHRWHSMLWLVILLLVNAAISAAYYLRIVATMFLRAEVAPATSTTLTPPGPHHAHSFHLETEPAASRPWPVIAGVALSVIATLLFGISFPLTGKLSARAQGVEIESAAVVVPAPTTTVSDAR
jgi:NADH-quinone oxidoreductase subunit N